MKTFLSADVSTKLHEGSGDIEIICGGETVATVTLAAAENLSWQLSLAASRGRYVATQPARFDVV